MCVYISYICYPIIPKNLETLNNVFMTLQVLNNILPILITITSFYVKNLNFLF